MINWKRMALVLIAGLFLAGVIAGCGQNAGPAMETTGTAEPFPAETEIQEDGAMPFELPTDGVGLVVSADPELITWHAYGVPWERINFAGLALDKLGKASDDLSLCYLAEDTRYFMLQDGTVVEGFAEQIIPGSIVGVTTLEEGVQEVYILYVPVEQEESSDGYTQGTVDEIPVSEVIMEGHTKTGPSFKVLTQNILFKNIDGGNAVWDRQPRFKSLVEEQQPDIMCIQECSEDWKYYINKNFSGQYTLVPAESYTGTTENLIYVRADRFTILDSGVIWLSATPERLSQFPDASGPRTCNWALIKDVKTGEILFIANAHLDWNNDAAREKQLDVLLTHFDSYFQMFACVVCGDFNSNPDGPIYALARQSLLDARMTAPLDSSKVNFTYHNFGKARNLIDYIFHTDKLYPEEYEIISKTYGGQVSDHYGVITEFYYIK